MKDQLQENLSKNFQLMKTGKKSSPPLRLVFWETTAGCNLECHHCRRLEVSKTLSRYDLSTEEAKKFISEISALGSPVLVLSGGEPLLRPDIFELGAFARACGLKVALATNGTLITPALAEKIKNSGIQRVAVSLDGANAKVNDTFRGIDGAFLQAVQGIKYINQTGIATQINFTLACHNVSQMEEIFELAKELKVCALHLFMLVPVGCGVEIALDEMLSPQEYEVALHRFSHLSLKYQQELETRATCAPHYYRIKRMFNVQCSTFNEVNEQEQAVMRRFTRGCLAGINVCFISHRGEVFPCGYLPVSTGNVKERSFQSIWEESEIFRELRDYSLLKGKCGICPYIKVCGGCRARAFAETGDYLAEEPYCIYQPSTV